MPIDEEVSDREEYIPPNRRQALERQEELERVRESERIRAIEREMQEFRQLIQAESESIP